MSAEFRVGATGPNVTITHWELDEGGIARAHDVMMWGLDLLDGGLELRRQNQTRIAMSSLTPLNQTAEDMSKEAKAAEALAVPEGNYLYRSYNNATRAAGDMLDSMAALVGAITRNDDETDDELRQRILHRMHNPGKF